MFDVNQRQIKRMQKTVEQIDALESSIKPLTDEQLKGKTLEFKERLTKGETVDDLLPEAFAVVRGGNSCSWNASIWRTVNGWYCLT